jgi:hypothetical protein
MSTAGRLAALVVVYALMPAAARAKAPYSPKVLPFQWISERLARLSPDQWQDAFRAAGYSESDDDRYIGRLRQQVAAGLAPR